MEEAAVRRAADRITMADALAIAARWTEIEAAMTDADRRSLVWELVKDVTISNANRVTVSGLLSIREKVGMVGGTGLEPVTSSV